MARKDRLTKLEHTILVDSEINYLYIAVVGKKGEKITPIGIEHDREQYYLLPGETFEDLKRRVEALCTPSQKYHLMRCLYEEL